MQTIEHYSNEAQWLLARKNGIGASEAAAVLGEDENKTPLQLYLEKISEGVSPEPPSEAAEVGNLLEELVLRMYTTKTGRKLEAERKFTIRRHPSLPHLFASLDATAIDMFDGRGPGVVDSKTSGDETFGTWREGVPLKYQIQIQQQMLVTNRSWGALAVFFTGKRQFKFYEYTRNEKFLKLLLEKTSEFWKRVEERSPPPADYRDLSTLKTLYEHHESVVELPESLSELVKERNEIAQDLSDYNSLVKALESEKEERDAKILEALQGASVGTLGGVPVVEVKMRKAFDVPARHQEAIPILYYKDAPKD